MDLDMLELELRRLADDLTVLRALLLELALLTSQTPDPETIAA